MMLSIIHLKYLNFYSAAVRFGDQIVHSRMTMESFGMIINIVFMYHDARFF